MGEEKISFNDWADKWYDGIGEKNYFRKDIREKMYGLLKHTLGLKEHKENKDKKRGDGTIIGYKRLALEYPRWPAPTEWLVFQLFNGQKLKTLKSFADEYKRLQEENPETDMNKGALSVNQLAEEFCETLGKSFLDELGIPYVEPMQMLSGYMEMIWDDDVDDEAQGGDLLEEMLSRYMNIMRDVGLLEELRGEIDWNNIMGVVISGEIRSIKAIIHEHEQIRQDIMTNENELKIVDRKDIKRKEKLRNRIENLEKKQGEFRKRIQKLTQKIRDYPFGLQPWFRELNLNDQELFDMLYKNASDISAECWKKIDKDKLVSLLRESYESGCLSVIQDYIDMDIIEMRIRYPDIVGMKEIEEWSEYFCPEKILNIMQNCDETNQNGAEAVKWGKNLLELGSTIAQKKSEVSHLIKELLQLIDQCNEQGDRFEEYTVHEDSHGLELKICEFIGRQGS